MPRRISRPCLSTRSEPVSTAPHHRAAALPERGPQDVHHRQAHPRLVEHERRPCPELPLEPAHDLDQAGGDFRVAAAERLPFQVADDVEGGEFGGLGEAPVLVHRSDLLALAQAICASTTHRQGRFPEAAARSLRLDS